MTTNITEEKNTASSTEEKTMSNNKTTNNTVGSVGDKTNDRKSTTTATTTTRIATTTKVPYESYNFYGRFLKSSSGYQFDWSGSTIEAAFKGTEVTMTMNIVGGKDTDYFNIYIDDCEPTLLTVTSEKSVYLLAKELKDDYHTVRVEKRTEAKQGGICEFVQFRFPGGKLQAPPARKVRSIEIIGDSISAGYGNESAYSSSGFRAIEENFAKTYGKLAADLLNAQVTVLASSGGGMYMDGGKAENNVFAKKLFWQTLGQKESKDWSFAEKPDVLVINLGTNDFYANGSLESFREAYTNCYIDFLSKVREKYPNTHIVCAIGTMLYTAKPAIQDVVTARKNAGDMNISFLQMSLVDTPSAKRWGADGHPSALAHEEMAEQLAAHIADQMNWK